MTEQQACTLCGAGGHTAAQCNWNKADGAPGEWERCQQLADLPRIHELLQAFGDDPSGDSGVMIVREVLRAAEPERLISALRYKAELYDEVWSLVTAKGYMNVTTAIAKLEAERDAAQARVAELEKQEPVALANRGFHAFWVKWTEPAAGLYGPGIKLYAHPVAQAGQVPEVLLEAIKWADHLLFECGALVQTRAPSVHVYNQAYAAVEAAKAVIAAAPPQGGE